MTDQTSDRIIEAQELWDLLKKVCPQLASESAKAYRAFADTAFSGLSIRRLLSRYTEVAHLIQESYVTTLELPPTLKAGTLFTWSKQYHWQQRLKQWKPIHEAYKRKQWNDRERAIIDRWNATRTRFLDGAEKMLEKAELMLKHPHVERVINQQAIAEYPGQIIPTKTVIVPSKWAMRDIAAFYKIALDLMIDVVGDRQVMIDRLHADGFVITDPTAGDSTVEEYLGALERLEELQG